MQSLSKKNRSPLLRRELNLISEREPNTRPIFAEGTQMDTGSSNNRRGVRGMSGAYGGEEPQPQDAQVGGWSRAQREQMDEKFRQAFERALRQEGGDERR